MDKCALVEETLRVIDKWPGFSWSLVKRSTVEKNSFYFLVSQLWYLYPSSLGCYSTGDLGYSMTLHITYNNHVVGGLVIAPTFKEFIESMLVSINYFTRRYV